MSYKVYWLFKETDEPFGSGFIYSRGEVGVKTGFPAAVSSSPIAASFSSSALSPQEFGETRGVLSSRKCSGRITNARSSPLSTWEPSSLTSSFTVRGRITEERRKKQNKDSPSSMRTSPSALENPGGWTTLPHDFCGSEGFLGRLSFWSLCSKRLWAPSRAWLAGEAPDSHCGGNTHTLERA